MLQFLGWFKLKAFANCTLNLSEIIAFVCESVENLVGKGENAGHQHFLLFPQDFQRAVFRGLVKLTFVKAAKNFKLARIQNILRY